MVRWVTIGCVMIMGVLIGINMATTVEAGDPSNTEQSDLTWHRFDRALALARREKKHILIDFYTDWCGWCKVMDEKTYGNDAIEVQLNKSFLLVKINAESKNVVKFEGRNLTEAQIASMFRVRSFPTTWFLEPDGEPITSASGYFAPDKFAPVLRYIEGGWYTKMPFDQFLTRASD